MFREGVSAGADAWGEASKQAHKLGPGKKPQEHKSAVRGLALSPAGLGTWQVASDHLLSQRSGALTSLARLLPFPGPLRGRMVAPHSL